MDTKSEWNNPIGTTEIGHNTVKPWVSGHLYITANLCIITATHLLTNTQNYIHFNLYRTATCL